MTKYAVLVPILTLALNSPSMGGAIERALGGDRMAHRTLESIATSDFNSRALDSFVRGVEQMAKNPGLTSLPSVQVGRRTVSLDGLAPLIEMAKKLKDQSPLSPVTSDNFRSLALPSSISAPSSIQSLTSPFSSLERAIEASPLPTSARADLSRMVKSVKELTSAR